MSAESLPRVEPMSAAKFASFIGQSRASVGQGISRGRLPDHLLEIDETGPRKKIKILDPEEAKQIWFSTRSERNVPSSVDQKEKRAIGREKKQAVNLKNNLPQGGVDPNKSAYQLPDVLNGVIPARAESSAIIEAAKAEQEILKLQTEKGDRLRRDEIARIFGQVMSGLKNDLGGLPSELISQHPDLPSEAIVTMKKLIDNALRKVGGAWK